MLNVKTKATCEFGRAHQALARQSPLLLSCTILPSREMGKVGIGPAVCLGTVICTIWAWTGLLNPWFCPHSQVLVCAPSNIAVDQLTEKIHKTGLKVWNDTNWAKRHMSAINCCVICTKFYWRSWRILGQAFSLPRSNPFGISGGPNLLADSVRVRELNLNVIWQGKLAQFLRESQRLYSWSNMKYVQYTQGNVATRSPENKIRNMAEADRRAAKCSIDIFRQPAKVLAFTNDRNAEQCFPQGDGFNPAGANPHVQPDQIRCHTGSWTCRMPRRWCAWQPRAARRSTLRSASWHCTTRCATWTACQSCRNCSSSRTSWASCPLRTRSATARSRGTASGNSCRWVYSEQALDKGPVKRTRAWQQVSAASKQLTTGKCRDNDLNGRDLEVPCNARSGFGRIRCLTLSGFLPCSMLTSSAPRVSVLGIRACPSSVSGQSWLTSRRSPRNQSAWCPLCWAASRRVPAVLIQTSRHSSPPIQSWQSQRPIKLPILKSQCSMNLYTSSNRSLLVRMCFRGTVYSIDCPFAVLNTCRIV